MKIVRMLCVLALLVTAVSAVAQEGFPLSGTWSGNWGPTAKEDDRNHTTIVMTWDGKKITGLVDPGPDSATFKVANLDPTRWTVHLEYDLKDRAGKLLPFVVDARLLNAASRNKRTLDGTYTHGAARGTFKILLDQ